jgi:hypothetical protein
MTESTETLFLDSGGLKLAYDIRLGVGHELLDAFRVLRLLTVFIRLKIGIND